MGCLEQGMQAQKCKTDGATAEGIYVESPSGNQMLEQRDEGCSAHVRDETSATHVTAAARGHPRMGGRELLCGTQSG